jgi:hypothetical protein
MKVSNFSFEKAKKVELEIILPTQSDKRFRFEDDGNGFDNVLPVLKKTGKTHPSKSPDVTALFLTQDEMKGINEKKMNLKVGQELKLHYLLGKSVKDVYWEKHNAKGFSESSIKKFFKIFRDNNRALSDF